MTKKVAFEWYLKAAELDERDIFIQVGLMYYASIGTEVEYEKAFYWTEKAAKYTDNSAAEYNIAEMYFHGCGVKQDYDEAMNLPQYTNSAKCMNLVTESE